ncbi:hypothetical protein ELS19_04575 [Halogeometricum borinquense]|uniref:Metal-dependent hydrolase n=1 Tax=Halogeometricum borinquense TaxID=60847 RepID=A0A482T6J5_9EURY|nr:hypothetical protein [Halogeometricum borinquense]RYJ13310.1 hypothetical protein ELS19_04575 [Halogeometricum borinquense]
MKSGEHAAVGGVVSVVAAFVLFPGSTAMALVALVGAGIVVSVLIDLDHFVIARWLMGDWRHLERAVKNPRVGLIEQEKVFADMDGEGLTPRRLLSHHLIGGVVTFAVVLVGRPTLAAFVAIVLYAHIVCDYLRDLDYA